MDDEQTGGSGQSNQRGNYSRPFFYVQPPNQPYHHQPPYHHHQPPYHHWHLNNQYYGLPPVPGYPYTRPYMPPYPYMQFPGYFVPQAPVHPVDYRRLFEPHIYPNAGQDVRFRHQHYQQQPSYFRREMACSEAQTDPRAALNKIIESLEKLRASEIEKELDSGVASQTSGLFSPDHKKQQDDYAEEGAAAVPVPMCATLKGNQSSPSMAFSETATAMYDDKSGQSLLDDLAHPKCWPQNSDEEMPLGSSSIHEDTGKPQLQGEEDQPVYLCPPRPQDTDSQLENGSASPDTTSKAKGPLKHSHGAIILPLLPTTRISDWQALQHEDHISKIDYHQQSTDGRDLATIDTDLTSKILKLPFEKVLTAGALQRESPLLCAKSHAMLSSTGISSSTHSYYPGYWPPSSTHGRMSILSPSVDELSSRDEMFSTDLDDMDLFPKHEYSSKHLTEAVVGLPSTSDEVVWPKRLLCACCGMNLSKRTIRSKGHCPQPYDDEEGDSDEERTFGRCSEHQARQVIKKHLKKSHCLSLRHTSKDVRGHGPDLPGTVDKQEEREVFEGPESSGQDPGDLRHRTYQGDTLDQNRWECQDAQPKKKIPALPQRHDRLRQRKATYKPHPVYHGSREEDEEKGEEPPQCQRVKRIPQ